MNITNEKIMQVVNFIKEKIEITPEIAVVLGSGLGDFTDKIENKTIIEYGDIPNFPITTVKGHGGQLIVGEISGKKIIAMKGRFHYYEGYSMQEVTFPIRVFKKLGIEKLIILSSVGGINENLKQGDIVIIKDYIKLSSLSPLIGPNLDEFGERFPNMNKNNLWIEKAKGIFKRNNIEDKEAVYAFMAGPQYETKAEVNMLRILGADVVGMSTVPEIIVGKHCNIEVSTFCLVTNSVLESEKLSHKEVLEVANKSKEKLTKILEEYIEEI